MTLPTKKYELELTTEDLADIAHGINNIYRETLNGESNVTHCHGEQLRSKRLEYLYKKFCDLWVADHK